MANNDAGMSVIGSYGTRGLLLASGLIAAGIAALILFAPKVFYAGYGIEIGKNVSLANELKAPAGALLLGGLLILVGVFKSKFIVPSLATAAAIYLSYGFSRILSMVIDGVPQSGLVSAATLELVIGTICFVSFKHHRKTAIARHTFADDVWHEN